MTPSPINPIALHVDDTMPERHFSKVFHRDNPSREIATFCDPVTHTADAQAFLSGVTADDLLRIELEDEKDDHARDNRDNHGTLEGLRREIAELKRLRRNETQRTLAAMAQADDLLQRFGAMERERDHAQAQVARWQPAKPFAPHDVQVVAPHDAQVAWPAAKLFAPMLGGLASQGYETGGTGATLSEPLQKEDA